MTLVAVPTTRTRTLAVKMVAAARDEGSEAVRLLRNLERGQEAALVAVLLGLASGSGSHARSGPVAVKVARPKALNLIVCGTCGALIHESCKTRAGRSRADHKTRLFPRRCPCGEVIPKRRGQRWCEPCGELERRANQQKYDRARRKSK